jgi:PAS domain S-box-containing protein
MTHRREWRLMVRLNERVNTVVDLGCRRVAAEIAETLRAELGDAATLVLLDPYGETEPLAVFAHANATRRADVERLLGVLGPEEIRDWVYSRGEADARLYGTSADRSDLDVNRKLRKHHDELKPESVAFAPLHHLDGSVRGLLICTRDNGSAEYSESDLEIVVHAAHTASMLLSVASSRATERMRTRYWESSFESSNVGKLILDADRYIIRANEAAAQMSGREAWQLLGLRYPVNVDEDVAAATIADIERARHGLPVPLRHREIHRPDGTSRFVQRTISTVLDDTGTAELFNLQFVDVTTLHAAEVEIVELAEQRRLLLAELVSAEQAERNRIGQEVHDDSIQLLAAAQLRMQLLVDQLSDNERANAAALTVSDLLSTAHRRLRQLLLELEPPASVDRPLSDSIVHVASIFFEETDTRVSVSGSLDELPPEVAAVFFRAARECLSNARRHAHASRVEVLLTEDNAAWQLSVTDNGIGVPHQLTSEPGHLGLRGIHSRAEALGGSCTIRRGPGGGIEVLVAVPKPTATKR